MVQHLEKAGELVQYANDSMLVTTSTEEKKK